MKIAILDDYQGVVRNLACFNVLIAHEVTVFTNPVDSKAALVQRLMDFEVLVLIRERTIIDDDLLSQLPNLKLISQTGKISNHIDMVACARYGVVVVEGRGSPVAPAELCWALIMNASRHISAYASNLKQGQWQSSGELGLGRTLSGLTLGIWGYGKIGQRIAQYGRTFGMNILVWGSNPSLEKARQDGFVAAESRQAFFQHSDVLTLHLRLVDATREIVRLEDLQQMKKDALIVNTSRAELIEAGALYTALLENTPACAALDVYENEPCSRDNEPLLSLPTVLASPHLGYVEKNSYELYFRIAFENIVAFVEGRPESIAQ